MNQNTFQERCDTFMAGCFFAMIYFLPISNALLEWCMGLALLGYLVKRSHMLVESIRLKKFIAKSFKERIALFFRCYQPVENCLNSPIAFFIFVNLVTVIISLYPMLSLKALLAKVMQGVFVYFTFIECMTTKKRLKIFLGVFFFSSILIMVNGLFQHFTGQDFIRGRMVVNGRSSSSFRQANDFGTYLVVIIPLFLSLILLARKIIKKGIPYPKQGTVFGPQVWKLLLVISLIMALICLGLTYSRGAWVALIVVLFYMGKKNKRFIISYTVILILFLAIFMPRILEVREDWSTWEFFFVHNNRLTYWAGVLPMINDFYVFGTGLNTFSAVEREYNVKWGGYPHNCFLQMTVETGIIGLGAFIWIYFTLFKRSLHNLRRIKNPYFNAILFGFLTALIGYLTHAFLDTTLYTVQLGNFLWLLTGIIVAIQKMSDQKGLLKV